MNFFFSTLNSFFDLLFWPLRGLAPAWAVVAFSLPTAILMLLVFRYFSNQTAIRRAKDRLGAHLLEVRLFQDQVGIVMRAYGRLLAATGAYLLHSLRPLAVMLLPLLLMVAQMELRLGRISVAGAPVLLKATFAAETALDSAELKTPSGVAITAPPFRIPEFHEMDWRIAATRSGEFSLEVVVAGASHSKQFSTLGSLARISPLRTSSFVELLLYPGEPRLPAGALQSLELTYPIQEVSVLGWKMHWLIPFLVFSLAFSFLFKGVMGVEF